MNLTAILSAAGSSNEAKAEAQRLLDAADGELARAAEAVAAADQEKASMEAKLKQMEAHVIQGGENQVETSLFFCPGFFFFLFLI